MYLHRWAAGSRPALIVLLVLLLAGCYRDNSGLPTPTPDFPPPLDLTPQPVQIDGSALMQPLVTRLAAAFQQAVPGVQVVVGASGTQTGFARLCAGEFPLLNAIRSMREDEAALCRTNGVAVVEIPLAYQAVAVVVPVGNTFAGCLNMAQIAGIWRLNGAVQTWRQVNLQFPDTPLAVYAPPADSLAYNLFQERVLDGGVLRPAYEGLPVGPEAIGFVELGEALRLQGSLRLLPVTFIGGVEAICITPGEATVLDGSYAPLSRTLFVYADAAALAQPGVAQFLRFVLDPQAEPVFRAMDLIPLPAGQRAQTREQLGLTP